MGHIQVRFQDRVADPDQGVLVGQWFSKWGRIRIMLQYVFGFGFQNLVGSVPNMKS